MEPHEGDFESPGSKPPFYGLGLLVRCLYANRQFTNVSEQEWSELFMSYG